MMKTHVMLQGSCDGKRQTYCGRFVEKAAAPFSTLEHAKATCLRCRASRLLRADLFNKYNRSEMSMRPVD